VKTFCRTALSAAIAGSIAIAAGSAAAAVLEEVVVTAQKREQSLQDVGISVTAFTGDQVRELGFTNTTDIVGFTPGLNYTVPNGEGSQVNFFLRGVGLNDFADANENPVATYFDEVYRGAVGGLALQIFDIERVEVLRGPQGTLYGRNTTGGLIHFVSRKPTEEFDGYGTLTLGSYSQVKFEGAVGGALTDTLFARASVATNNDNGWTENRFPGVDDYNETDSVAGRLQFLWQPHSDFELYTKFHASENDSQVGAWQHQVVAVTEGGNNRRAVGPTENLYGAGPGNDAFGYRDTDGDPFAGEYDRDGSVRVQTSGASVAATWRLNDSLDFISITAYDQVDRLQEEDTEASPAPLLNPTFEAATEQFTQEVRLQYEGERSRWVGGFYYFDQDVNADYTLDLLNLGFVFFDADYEQESRAWSVFGQYEYDLSPEWSVVAGLRYTNELKEINYRNRDTSGLYAAATAGLVPPAALGLTAPPPLTAFRPNPSDAFIFNQSTVGDVAEQNFTNLTGKIEVDYRPNDDWLVYASFSRGVKSAGFNTGFLDGTFIFASNTVETIPFDQERLHAYELGFKGTLFDNRVRVNGAGFYYDYKDFQTFQFELLNQIIFNTDAEVYGGELELQASPAEGWDIALGLSVLEATAKDVPAAGTGIPRDRRMVSAPEVTFNGLVRYEWPMFGGMMAGLAKVLYQGETFYDIQNYDTSVEDGYTKLDLRLQWTSGDDHWEVATFVDNVTETEYLAYAFDFSGFGFNQLAYGRPRWFGGSVTYRF